MKIKNFNNLFKLSSFKIYWPYFIFGIFFIGIIVNIIYVFIAKESWQGVFFQSNENKKILKAYNDLKKSNLEEQKKLGIKIISMVKPISSNRFKIETIVMDNENKVISGIKVFYGLTYVKDPKINFGVDAISNAEMYYHQNIDLNKDGPWSLETKVDGYSYKASDTQIIEAKTPEFNKDMINI